MVVITLEKCPASMRGDLTKWLQEISLGVYVGQVSARVRENLWKRVCAEAKSGRATLVYSAQNEQHMDFRVHNTSWEPIDFDGMKLMLRPSPSRVEALGKKRVGYSEASKRYVSQRGQRNKDAVGLVEYIVVDLETTGLCVETDEIVEIAAIKIAHGEEVDRLHMLVRPEGHLPDSVVKLTGIDEELLSHGLELSEAIEAFLDFVGSCPLVMHNAAFDMDFIDAALERLEIDELTNDCIDTLALAKKKEPYAKTYRLADLVKPLGVGEEGLHRAMNDCLATKVLFESLMEPA